jgi:hypothetical protein
MPAFTSALAENAFKIAKQIQIINSFSGNKLR